VAGALLLGWLSPPVAAGGSALVVIPYLVIVLTGARVAPRPQEHPTLETTPSPTHHLLGLIVVDAALIIAGSVGMVQTALTLAGHWHVSHAILGVLILGPLTSIPNAATAVRLGLAGRGAALVGETFNSNTINLAAGVVIPSLFVTLAAVSTLAKLQLAWLLAATLLTLSLLARREGMERAGAVALILMYLAFAGGTLVGA
jgi:Ca2+/Na+ antiporter